MLPILIALVCMHLMTAGANEQLWNEFQLKHGKTYSSETEQLHRYTIFSNNLQYIQHHNAEYAQGRTSWYLGVNQFADLDQQEFNRFLTESKTTTYPRIGSGKPHIPLSEVPDKVDWRDKGVVTDVKNQGSCGSAWMFSMVGTLEGQYSLINNELIPLSIQNLVDCCSDSGCTGGFLQSCLDYVRQNGIATEASYPSQDVQGTCRIADEVFHVSDYAEIAPNDENDLKNAVGSAGPVAVTLNADMLQFYAGGVFNFTGCPTTLDHGMLAVGYGNDDDQDFWILKNSWGPSWGEDGYARIAMGYNLCAVAAEAYYPLP